MCIDPHAESATAARLRQHARDFKNERTARDGMHPGHPVGPGWVAVRNEAGEVGIVRDTRTTRKPPRMTRAMSAIVAAMWLGSIGASLTAVYFAAPFIFHLFVALVPKV